MTTFRVGQMVAALLAACLFVRAPAHAQQITPADEDHQPVTDAKSADEADIAKESQNPIGNLTIMPFENYTNFQFGPNKGTQNVLEFEPVAPFHITPDWNLITRAIIIRNDRETSIRDIESVAAAPDFDRRRNPRRFFLFRNKSLC